MTSSTTLCIIKYKWTSWLMIVRNTNKRTVFYAWKQLQILKKPIEYCLADSILPRYIYIYIAYKFVWFTYWYVKSDESFLILNKHTADGSYRTC